MVDGIFQKWLPNIFHLTCSLTAWPFHPPRVMWMPFPWTGVARDLFIIHTVWQKWSCGNFEAGLGKAMQLPPHLWGHFFVDPELQCKSLITLATILWGNPGQMEKLQGVLLPTAQLTFQLTAPNAVCGSERDFRWFHPSFGLSLALESSQLKSQMSWWRKKPFLLSLSNFLTHKI